MMTDVGGDRHGPVIYWVDMNGLRAFSTTPRECEKVLATYVKVPSASYVSDLEARLEKAEAERAMALRMCRENYDAFCAMRNDINEIVGNMASQESTLQDGPTMADECVAVVQSVSEYAAALKSQS